MSINWKLVTSAHVIEACQRLRAEEVTSSHPARNTFLIYNGKSFPAKFIRGLAYEIATGVKLNPNVDFSGGKETARFFEQLGFRVEYMPSSPNVKYQNRDNTTDTSSINNDDLIESKCLNEELQKKALKRILEQEFGKVEVEYGFNWLVVPNEASMDETITRLRQKLIRHRGFHDFYKEGRKLKLDFYVPNCRVVIEYDERQHFTEPRALCLEGYPNDLTPGFDRKKWIEISRIICAHDNDPPYRDEQRAFYDTLRDLLAVRNGFVLIRIKHGDWDWNRPESGEYVRELIQKATSTDIPPGEAWHIEIKQQPKARLGRIIITNAWQGNVTTARTLLEQICTKWPLDLKVDFLATCGAFLRFDWPASLLPVRDYLHPEPTTVKTLLHEARQACDLLLDGIASRLAKRVQYMTIGIDAPLQNKITTTKNRITVPHIELVFVVDLCAQPLQYYWTGKSYPTCSQAHKLVRIEDLTTHFLDLGIGKAMVLGCHDLTMFNPRARSVAKGWRKDVQEQFLRMAKRECPSIVLHHPHTTVKMKTWLLAWNQLGSDLPSVTEFVGSGRYQEDDVAEKKWDALSTVLNSTKNCPTVDLICSFRNNC